MTWYILDSDHVTLHQRRELAVVQRLADVPPDQVFVPIVTAEEQLRGWLAMIRRASTPERLIAAYASLHRAVIYFAQVNITHCRAGIGMNAWHPALHGWEKATMSPTKKSAFVVNPSDIR